MKILALEPYYGGSHRAFLDGWVQRSRHTWDVFTLPAHNWKWRMRHAAVTFSDMVKARRNAGAEWDAVWCSDMLDLAGFLGLAGRHLQGIPVAAYFHENQLTYPDRQQRERDYHFAFTNMTTGLAADAVWFNSGWHRDNYLGALEELLKRMTSHSPSFALAEIREKCRVQEPGIACPPRGKPNAAEGPMHLIWAARWEHDKNPEDFFEAIELVLKSGVLIQISVLGESFSKVPAVFDRARNTFDGCIRNWGFAASPEDYFRILSEGDLFISTARHEFFGIGAVEAAASGCIPLLPDRLAYPEVFRRDRCPEFFYGQDHSDLAETIQRMAEKRSTPEWERLKNEAMACASPFRWDVRADALDSALCELEELS